MDYSKSKNMAYTLNGRKGKQQECSMRGVKTLNPPCCRWVQRIKRLDERDYILLTLAAAGPLGPSVISNLTLSPSFKVLKPSATIAE